MILFSRLKIANTKEHSENSFQIPNPQGSTFFKIKVEPFDFKKKISAKSMKKTAKESPRPDI